MQDHRRNGWYVLGAAMITAGVAWLAAWGVAVDSAKPPGSLQYLSPASYTAIGVVVLGFLVVVAVMYDAPARLVGFYPSVLGRRAEADSTSASAAHPGYQVPETLPLGFSPLLPFERLRVVMVSAIAEEETRELMRVGGVLKEEIKRSGAGQSPLSEELPPKISKWEEDMKVRLTVRPDFRLHFQNPGLPAPWNPFTATVAEAYDRIDHQLERLREDIKGWH